MPVRLDSSACTASLMRLKIWKFAVCVSDLWVCTTLRRTRLMSSRRGRDAGVVIRQGSQRQVQLNQSLLRSISVPAEADRHKGRRAPVKWNKCNQEDGDDATVQGSVWTDLCAAACIALWMGDPLRVR